MAIEGNGNPYLEEVYLTHRLSVFKFLKSKTHNDFEAECLTADTFAKLAEMELRKGGIQKRAEPIHWLFTVATHLFIDSRRDDGHYQADGLDSEEVGHLSKLHSHPAELSVDLNLRDEAVLTALGTLTEEQSKIIGCIYGLGLSVHETAQMFGKTEGNVRGLRNKAILKLKECLGVNR